jgi:ADP-ribose pyrophosphatase
MSKENIRRKFAGTKLLGSLKRFGKSSDGGLVLLRRGKHLDFVKRDRWEFVHRPTISGIVVIVATTRQRKILLVEQFRPPVNATVLELPAGLAGDVRGSESEELLEAAKRELVEETGYVASAWKQLFSGPPSAGVSSEVVTFFRATGLRRASKGGGDKHENILVHEIPLRSVEAWLQRECARGVLIDPKVYAGLHWL